MGIIAVANDTNSCEWDYLSLTLLPATQPGQFNSLGGCPDTQFQHSYLAAPPKTFVCTCRALARARTPVSTAHPSYAHLLIRSPPTVLDNPLYMYPSYLPYLEPHIYTQTWTDTGTGSCTGRPDAAQCPACPLHMHEPLPPVYQAPCTLPTCALNPASPTWISWPTGVSPPNTPSKPTAPQEEPPNVLSLPPPVGQEALTGPATGRSREDREWGAGAGPCQRHSASPRSLHLCSGELSPCRINNGGCQDLCLLTHQGHVNCSCRGGRLLQEDLTCRGESKGGWD